MATVDSSQLVDEVQTFIGVVGRVEQKIAIENAL